MPRAVADAPHDFLAGLSTMAGAGINPIVT
jgi:hypothetical protein